MNDTTTPTTTDQAPTEALPSVAERIAETRGRLNELKTTRATTVLAATRGDKEARERLPTIVAQMQAAELELEMLGDAAQEEVRERQVQLTAQQAAARLDKLEQALAACPKLEALAAKAHKRLQDFLETAGEADELGAHIRSLVYDAMPERGHSATYASQKPSAEEVSTMCGLKSTPELRRQATERLIRHIQLKRDDLNRQPVTDGNGKVYRRGAKFIEPTPA